MYLMISVLSQRCRHNIIRVPSVHKKYDGAMESLLRRQLFAQFRGNSVKGSVNSLSPNTVYTMRVEAMDKTGNVLSCAELERSSCMLATVCAPNGRVCVMDMERKQITGVFILFRHTL